MTQAELIKMKDLKISPQNQFRSGAFPATRIVSKGTSITHKPKTPFRFARNNFQRPPQPTENSAGPIICITQLCVEVSNWRSENLKLVQMTNKKVCTETQHHQFLPESVTCFERFEGDHFSNIRPCRQTRHFWDSKKRKPQVDIARNHLQGRDSGSENTTRGCSARNHFLIGLGAFFLAFSLVKFTFCSFEQEACRNYQFFMKTRWQMIFSS